MWRQCRLSNEFKVTSFVKCMPIACGMGNVLHDMHALRRIGTIFLEKNGLVQSPEGRNLLEYGWLLRCSPQGARESASFLDTLEKWRGENRGRGEISLENFDLLENRGRGDQSPIHWVVPLPSNSGKRRFIGIPY